MTNHLKPIREYQITIPGFTLPVTVRVFPPGQAAGTESWCQLVHGLRVEEKTKELVKEEDRPGGLFAGLGLD